MKNLHRFRDHLPAAGEGKAPRAELTAEYDEASNTGTLFLYDVIDSWGGYWGTSALEFQTALSALGKVSAITLHVNSPGGEVYEAIAIKNLLAQHPAKVTVVVDGLAASAASFIAAAADELVMGENAELMIHDAWGIEVGNAADMRGFADQLDRISDNIASIYAKKAGGDTAQWRQTMVDEQWYSAQEAVAAGLADSVASTEPDEDDDPVDAFAALRSQFKHQNHAAAAAARGPSADDTQPDGPGHPARDALNVALGQFAAIDNIVDAAQASIATVLGVPNPDDDGDDDTSAQARARAHGHRARALRMR